MRFQLRSLGGGGGDGYRFQPSLEKDVTLEGKIKNPVLACEGQNHPL